MCGNWKQTMSGDKICHGVEGAKKAAISGVPPHMHNGAPCPYHLGRSRMPDATILPPTVLRVVGVGSGKKVERTESRPQMTLLQYILGGPTWRQQLDNVLKGH